jgi:hypothetical protein
MEPPYLCHLEVLVTLFAAPDLHLEEIQDANGASVLRGIYKGKTVTQALVLQNGEKCVILLDPSSCLELKSHRNLFCLDRDGQIAWIASLPETYDRFVEIRVGPVGLLANSHSGYLVTLEPATGRVIDQVFTK